ncbi:uncharacterized protein yor352w homologue, putative [Candida dubliniensis CD36]|uniref:Uncharacterized protein yor352w homologue, putative n=1 Tax=Candida dubliniensis (strain CD36 / ATCC MYA-646 / CBS 7987 / NCPF 3949 / NRRL Y-17841) TaxID=573826 RepID=B9WEN6_CANDC|nr:uncharacterized protein yor352w homologue, putative [Candida dubliniensis CD36]CAX43148.1 uncharacterized protein yor352w homologue, putative [Candida dubliniensis CD36]
MDIDNTNDISSPPTPIHPAPNEELTNGVPTNTLLADSNIDLNPDLYEEEEMQVEDSKDNSNDKGLPKNSTNDALLPPQSEGTSNNDVNGAITNADSDLEDVEINQLHQITLPFIESYQLLKQDFHNTLTNLNSTQITSAQQSKLINYIDETLLQIQRKFIKQQTESEISYSLIHLLQELSTVISVIWVSIQQKSVLYGQIEYYIKILGDLEDYVNNYKTLFNESWSNNNNLHINMQNLVIFFKFWQKIDLQLSFLIDGYNIVLNNDNQQTKLIKMNVTELTRLLPIVTRLRIAIISKIDAIRIRLKRNQESNSDNVATSNILTIFELEISRLFEGILERS